MKLKYIRTLRLDLTLCFISELVCYFCKTLIRYKNGTKNGNFNNCKIHLLFFNCRRV